MWTLGPDKPVIPGVPFIRCATALPLATAGSLRPAFAPARHVCLAVKLPYCLYTLRTISNRAEGTFARLRYILGGDRPSQTTRLTLSTARIHGAVLEAQNTKGGISRAAPQQPKPLLHSLPPILSKMSQTPISGCSKGSRGLSVWPRVLGIFTETAISPSPSLRQRPSRYAIRAGRNLPDKEFRYLRTVRDCYSSATVRKPFADGVADSFLASSHGRP